MNKQKNNPAGFEMAFLPFISTLVSNFRYSLTTP